MSDPLALSGKHSFTSEDYGLETVDDEKYHKQAAVIRSLETTGTTDHWKTLYRM